MRFYNSSSFKKFASKSSFYKNFSFYNKNYISFLNTNINTQILKGMIIGQSYHMAIRDLMSKFSYSQLSKLKLPSTVDHNSEKLDLGLSLDTLMEMVKTSTSINVISLLRFISSTGKIEY